MTERLTKRVSDVVIQVPDGFQKAVSKLAHYEDLEEQGRLIVLPKELDPKRLLNIIADLICPRYVGLEDWGHDKEKCPKAGCNECWEKAFKESDENGI